MASTVRDFITQALTLKGIIAQGQLPNASEWAYCFTELNTLLDEWNVEGTSLFTQARFFLNLVAGKPSYTMGPGYADFPLYPRPARIVSAAVIVLNIRKPVELIVAAQFSQIPEPTEQSIHARQLYCDYNYPFSTLYPWPVPAALGANLELFIWQALSQFANLDDSFDLPPAYRSALQNTLMMRVGPGFGWEPDQATLAIAGNAKSSIQKFNADTLGIPPGPPQATPPQG